MKGKAKGNVGTEQGLEKAIAEGSQVKAWTAVGLMAMASCQALAQTASEATGPVSGEETGLFSPNLAAQYSPLERIAAVATQNVYDFLSPACSNGAGAAASATLTFTCTPDLFAAFSHAREVVDTANQINSDASAGDSFGETQYSLNTDVDGLDAVLRWTADEEVSSQLSAARNFVAKQQGLIAARLDTLRNPLMAGAQNILVAAGLGGRAGGGASADDIGIASRWSAFVNGGYVYGDRADTTFRGGYEDAFSYHGGDANVGVDYRVSSSLVVGVLGGYTTRGLSFDGSVSVADGDLDIQGGGGSLYASWDYRNFYLSGSFGGQVLKDHLRRKIIYTSFNPTVPSTDETASSDTTTVIYSVTSEAGYNFIVQGWTLVPYLQTNYRNIDVSGFSEAAAGGLQFRVRGVSTAPVEMVPGFRVQYAYTPTFGGVFLPFLRAEYHREFNDDVRTESSLYVPLATLEVPAGSPYNAQNLSFAIPTDRPDRDFYSCAAGTSAVLPHGVQAFAQYQAIFGRRYYHDRAVNVGVRMEF